MAGTRAAPYPKVGAGTRGRGRAGAVVAQTYRTGAGTRGARISRGARLGRF